MRECGLSTLCIFTIFLQGHLHPEVYDPSILYFHLAAV
jgi:hypothetical protein